MDLPLYQSWYCPNCPKTEQTGFLPNRFHLCPKFGLMAPMLLEGTKGKVEAQERQDYMGQEKAQRIMAIVTTRDDGQDVIVFPGVAVGEAD